NLSGTTVTLPGPRAITAASNATPIVITSAGHGLAVGNYVSISGVQGNTAANGTWYVSAVPSSSTFTIQTLSKTNTAGNGAYTANTGAWVPAITAATNASPIVITTSNVHNLSTGATVVVSGVTG